MKTSYYYKYDFVSPEPIFAEVKEELKSYFQTGVVDDLLFTRYTEDALKSFGRSTNKIVEGVFQMEDFHMKLPEGFKAVRELWLVTPVEVGYSIPSARYEQSTIRITSVTDRCNDCPPKEIKVTCKTTGKIFQIFDVQVLLRPGNVSTLSLCSQDSLNALSSSKTVETFDIKNGKLFTNFPGGFLYMTYYIEEFDENDYKLIPDNYYIKKYLKAELKYKVFETVFNNVSDETYNQLQNKLMYYERLRDEAREDLRVELKKQTIEQVGRSIKYARRRLSKFNIS